LTTALSCSTLQISTKTAKAASAAAFGLGLPDVVQVPLGPGLDGFRHRVEQVHCLADPTSSRREMVVGVSPAAVGPSSAARAFRTSPLERPLS